MNRRRVIAAAALVLVIAAGWWVAERAYLSPARELRAKIDQRASLVENINTALRGRAALETRGDALGATMIAGAPDEVSHTLRAGIAAVAARAGLTNVSIGSGEGRGVSSPVIDATRRSALGRALRERSDFEVVPGWVTGTGELREVLTAVELLRAQPWVHRVDAFSIKPADNARRTFDLRVDLSTVVSGAVARSAGAIETVAGLSDESVSRVGALVEANPFATVIEAARVEVERPVASAPAPVRDPLRPWRLTGLIERSGEVEALLVNTSTRERASVMSGGSVGGATFREGSGERAVFEFGGALHEVLVGQSLGDRRSIARQEGS